MGSLGTVSDTVLYAVCGLGLICLFLLIILVIVCVKMSKSNKRNEELEGLLAEAKKQADENPNAVLARARNSKDRKPGSGRKQTNDENEDSLLGINLRDLQTGTMQTNQTPPVNAAVAMPQSQGAGAGVLPQPNVSSMQQMHPLPPQPPAAGTVGMPPVGAPGHGMQVCVLL